MSCPYERQQQHKRQRSSADSAGGLYGNPSTKLGAGPSAGSGQAATLGAEEVDEDAFGDGVVGFAVGVEAAADAELAQQDFALADRQAER